MDIKYMHGEKERSELHKLFGILLMNYEGVLMVGILSNIFS